MTASAPSRPPQRWPWYTRLGIDELFERSRAALNRRAVRQTEAVLPKARTKESLHAKLDTGNAVIGLGSMLIAPIDGAPLGLLAQPAAADPRAGRGRLRRVLSRPRGSSRGALVTADRKLTEAAPSAVLIA